MSLKHGFKQMVAEANAVIETVSVKDALAVVREAGYTFIDIREGDEREQGTIAGSVMYHPDSSSSTRTRKARCTTRSSQAATG